MFQGRNRFNADKGIRGGNPNPGPGMGAPQRAGFGSEQNPSAPGGQEVLSSSPAGNPHSSSGFKRALEKTARTSSRLKDQLPSKNDFGGKGFRKPNYFGQGGRRHGMHMGAGAPVVKPADETVESFGG